MADIPQSSPHDNPPPPGDAIGHAPVLLDETLALLAPQPGQTLMDVTLGRGGHAAAILPRIAGGRLIGLDTDPANADFARSRLEPIAAEHGVALDVIHINFAGVARVLQDLSLAGVDGLLADLGFASNQMDDPQRGFAFRFDGPLDMRLDPTRGQPASHLVNTLTETALADLIYTLGEDRASRRIAKKIIERRSISPILTTDDLARTVRAAQPHSAPGRRGPSSRGGSHGIDPATRTFMALRIAVNGELDALDTLLATLPKLLNPNGIAAMISFHSLEDRRVKQAFLKFQQDDWAQRLTRKPITAAPAELANNPRSRSAKLRGLQKKP
ncbi:MAG: 16S rRNA (cytosine(1402)-N(4))-methyltransferase RsmH [Algisphaera sp.]